MKKEDVKKDLKIVNYKEFPGHDGVPGFNLELKYKGKKILRIFDAAYGGEYEINVIGEIVRNKDGKYVDSPIREDNNALYNELKDRIKQLPKDEKYDLEEKLEYLVDELIDELRVEKDSKKGIVCKISYGHKIYGFKVQLPTLVKKYNNGLELVQQYYDELKADGQEILNTKYLASIGVKL